MLNPRQHRLQDAELKAKDLELEAKTAEMLGIDGPKIGGKHGKTM